jgi:hypothetical protein
MPIQTTACSGREPMAQATLLAILSASGQSPNILDNLSLDQWSITDFDPHKREVCVTVSISSGLRYLNFTIPASAGVKST